MKKFFLFLLLVPALLVQADNFYTVSEIMSIYNGLNLADGATTTETYTVRGYVTRWKSGYPNYQNADFFIDDNENGNGSTSLFECFRLTASVDADKRELSKGDYVEATGKLKRYGNQAELVSGTFRVLDGEAWIPIPVSISEFISRNDGKRYILTGVVTSIVSEQYGNLYLEDNTGSIYVYGISGFSNYDIAVDDTLTISGIYQLYGSTDEVTGGQYINHVHPTPVTPQDDNVDFLTVITAGGWDALIGRTVTFSNDFVYCDTWNNTIAPYRLRDAEEYGEEGSEAYNAMKAQISRDSCHLNGYTINWQTYRTGAIVRGLKAQVVVANRLQAVETPQMINNDFPTVRPDLGDANVVVCGANVENFFVDNASDAAKLEIQKQKISSALHNMNADIYALCEVEQGPNASQVLCDLLSELDGGTDLYAYVNGNSSSYNSGAVTFIYRKATVEPYGSYLFPYAYVPMKWREGIQCFRHKATNEKFNISMNHFWAKISKTDADREENMTKLLAKLPSATTNDPDVLVLGDLNAYTMENANQMLVNQKQYVDLLMKYAPEGYSHLYGCTAGYLDHAFCSPSMESQVTKAVPYHLNADSPKSIYGYDKGNNSMYRYSDHDPILVGLKLGNSSSIENVEYEAPAYKEIRHGQLIIIRSGVEYTVTGQRIR